MVPVALNDSAINDGGSQPSIVELKTFFEMVDERNDQYSADSSAPRKQCAEAALAEFDADLVTEKKIVALNVGVKAGYGVEDNTNKCLMRDDASRLYTYEIDEAEFNSGVSDQTLNNAPDKICVRPTDDPTPLPTSAPTDDPTDSPTPAPFPAPSSRSTRSPRSRRTSPPTRHAGADDRSDAVAAVPATVRVERDGHYGQRHHRLAKVDASCVLRDEQCATQDAAEQSDKVVVELRVSILECEGDEDDADDWDYYFRNSVLLGL